MLYTAVSFKLNFEKSAKMYWGERTVGKKKKTNQKEKNPLTVDSSAMYLRLSCLS